MTARIILMAVVLVTIVTGSGRTEETNPVLGKVGDFVLREADLDRIMASQPPAVQKRFQDDPRQKLGLVREILTKKAVVAKARKENFDRKPEIKEQLSYVYDNFIFQEYLGKVVTAGVTVPEEDLKKFYQVHEKDFQLPEQVKVRHILIASLKEDRPEEKEKARAKAEGILLRLKKGEDFAALAREFSDDQNSAQTGGELAVITPGKTNSEEFEKAAFAIKTGAISDIVTTSYGFHIIKVDERQEKRTASFPEARDFIYNKLKAELEQKKIQEFVEQIAKDAGLELTGELSGSAPDSSPAIPDNVKKNDLKK